MSPYLKIRGRLVTCNVANTVIYMDVAELLVEILLTNRQY